MPASECLSFPLDYDASPVLIVCAGRSGSTLLRNLLSRHPDLHVSIESHFWVEAAGERSFNAAPHRSLAAYCASAPFRWLRLDEDAVLALLPASPNKAQAFCALMQADAERHGKRRFGDKTPAHALVLRQLLRALPHARVVHLVRDPRDVVAALRRMPWASASLLLNTLYTWLSVESVLSCGRDDERVLHMRHEELIAAPEASVRRLLDHLHLDASDEAVAAMLEPAATANGVPKAAAAAAAVPWLADSFGRIRPAAERAKTVGTSAAPSALSPAAEALVERVCAHHMRVFGYARRHPDATWRTTLLAPFGVIEMGRALVAAVSACLAAATPSVDRLAGVPPEEQAERQLGRWLNLNPAAWRQWPGWDAQRAVAVQLHPLPSEG